MIVRPVPAGDGLGIAVLWARCNAHHGLTFYLLVPETGDRSTVR